MIVLLVIQVFVQPAEVVAKRLFGEIGAERVFGRICEVCCGMKSL